MKTSMVKNPTCAQLGLWMASLTALALNLLVAGSAVAVNYEYYGNVTPLPQNSSHGANFLLGSSITVTNAVKLQSFGVDFRQNGGQANIGLYAADGAGGDPGTLLAQTGSFAITTGVHELSGTTSPLLAPGSYWILAVFSQSSSVGYDTSDSAAVVKYRSLTFTGDLPASFGAATTYTGQKFNYYIKTRKQQETLLVKGAAVPGAGTGGVPTSAVFTGFGVPAISANGAVAVYGKWTSPTNVGAGIFVDGTLVAKLGQVVSGASAIKSMKDPVIDDSGHVSFIATLKGDGVAPGNDGAVIGNAPGGTLTIVAQEGTQAPGLPAGALWKSFSSLATAGDRLLIAGNLAPGRAGITATKDSGLWATDSEGVPHLVLQEGTTMTGGKVVKSFIVLKAVNGTAAQLHQANARGEIVSNVTFTDGTTAVALSVTP